MSGKKKYRKREYDSNHSILYKFHLMKNSLLVLYKFLSAYIIYTQNTLYVICLTWNSVGFVSVLRTHSTDIFDASITSIILSMQLFHFRLDVYLDRISQKYEHSGWIVRWKDASVQIYFFKYTSVQIYLNILLVKKMSFVSVRES